MCSSDLAQKQGPKLERCAGKLYGSSHPISQFKLETPYLETLILYLCVLLHILFWSQSSCFFLFFFVRVLVYFFTLALSPLRVSLSVSRGLSLSISQPISPPLTFSLILLHSSISGEPSKTQADEWREG